MRENQSVALMGEKVILVPYRPYHVEVYHKWMSDPEMLSSTGSEPLSLAQECEMQQKWAVDPDKCTFIVLCRQKYTDSLKATSSQKQASISSMIGDVNLFLYESENNPSATVMLAELEIMIADKGSQNRGFGKQATCMMILYAFEDLGVKNFVVKINEDNEISLGMFESLGFAPVSYSSVFKQRTMRLNVDDEYAKQLRRKVPFKKETFSA